ncbi:hypothetical protein LEMLEM_LOCUS27705 [Lemmus lemmus]
MDWSELRQTPPTLLGTPSSLVTCTCTPSTRLEPHVFTLLRAHPCMHNGDSDTQCPLWTSTPGSSQIPSLFSALFVCLRSRPRGLEHT